MLWILFGLVAALGLALVLYFSFASRIGRIVNGPDLGLSERWWSELK